MLLDEFGAGTDPAQGAALAQGVLDGLLDKQTFVLAATHFPALKTYALSREGARAASVLFDPQSKKPLFKLAYDQVGASQALDVAREHGLPESILRRAEHYLLQDGQDTSALLGRLNALAAEREQEIARLRQEQEKARRDTQIMREKTEKERLRLHDEVRAKAGELMRAWKEGRATHKQALKEMSRLRADLAAPVVQEETSVLPQIEHFAPGQQVFHTVFNKRGVVTDVDERRKRVRVDLNGVSLWAAMKDVRQSGQSAQAAAPVRRSASLRSRPPSPTTMRPPCASTCAACVPTRPRPKWNASWTRPCFPASVKWRSCTVAAPAPCVARSMIFCAPSRPWPVLPPLRRIAAAMA